MRHKKGESAPHRIIVIGGGAGGLELVTGLGDTLGRRGVADVSLIDKSRTHLWKPLLHEVAAGSGAAKDYEFSRRTMEEHWLAGYRDTVHSLDQREIFKPPDRLEGVRTFDFSKTQPISEERNDERA